MLLICSSVRRSRRYRSNLVREAESVDAPAPQMTEKTTSFSSSFGSAAESSSGTSYRPSTGMKCVQKVDRTLRVDVTRLLSTVGTYSFARLRTKVSTPGRSFFSHSPSCGPCGLMAGLSARSQPSICAPVPTTFSGSIKMVPTRDTVAGEATARSSTSNTIVIKGDMAIISPEERHIFLLSSSTVFIDSIHRVSTGPSISSHFSSGFSSAHTSRITLASTPSVHSKVLRSYSPYRLAYGTALGLMTIGRTDSKPSTPAFLRLVIAAASTFHAVDLPLSDGPTSMLPCRVSLDS
mmetsp:Transcript_24915/g.78450  ORF Transcript_24915/g.78450 Transcript_24915/m.78450 type:complete len:293 (-) Transcript_24915:3241-4119(-)